MRSGIGPASRAFATRLIEWYSVTRRSMPWREGCDPYRVWISEIMLQQTRAKTVIPFFERWMDRFPNVRALADADLADVLKSWEGLGYYARARNLHRAARTVRDAHGGVLPPTYEDLRALPGFGPYTAAAVASIAFGERVPVVDGNVLRVAARHFGLESDVTRSATRTEISRLLAPLVPSGTPGDFNQALMELGATVCLPRAPRCTKCPVARSCRARSSGRTDELPRRSPRRPVPHHEVAVGVVWRGDRFLIGRRREDRMLGGLWELPGGKRHPGEPLAETARREIREETGLEVVVGAPYGTVEHAYTHFRITMAVFRCEAMDPAAEPEPLDAEALSWTRLEEVSAYAFPRATHRAFELVREREARGRFDATAAANDRQRDERSTTR